MAKIVIGAFEQLFASGRGDLNTNFLKIQMPGGGGGKKLKFRFDWYITKRAAMLCTFLFSYNLCHLILCITIFCDLFIMK